MGCGSSASSVSKKNVGPLSVDEADEAARKCNNCQASCVLRKVSGACSMCGADMAAECWCCRGNCGFLVCLTCELHLAMTGDSVERLRLARHAFKEGLDSASIRRLWMRRERQHAASHCHVLPHSLHCLSHVTARSFVLMGSQR